MNESKSGDALFIFRAFLSVIHLPPTLFFYLSFESIALFAKPHLLSFPIRNFILFLSLNLLIGFKVAVAFRESGILGVSLSYLVPNRPNAQ